MSRFLEDEDFIDHEHDEEIAEIVEEEDEDLLEEEETLEELDVDDRGHVRPRRRARHDEEIDPEEY
jgi:hypothetical protein